jgi:hypothetical protein
MSHKFNTFKSEMKLWTFFVSSTTLNARKERGLNKFIVRSFHTENTFEKNSHSKKLQLFSGIRVNLSKRRCCKCICMLRSFYIHTCIIFNHWKL